MRNTMVGVESERLSYERYVLSLSVYEVFLQLLLIVLVFYVNFYVSCFRRQRRRRRGPHGRA